MKHLFTPFIAILSLWLVLNTSTLHAQVTTRHLSGNKASITQFGAFGPLTGTTAKRELTSSSNVATLKTQDAQDQKIGQPLRVAVRENTDVNLLTDGTISDQNGYRVYQYEVSLPGAIALSAIFDQLQLAEGARLFLYDAAQTMLVGPITNQQNIANGTTFSSGHVMGDRLMIELQEPLAVAGQSQLHLAGVANFYSTKGPFGALQPADPCQNNMVCFPAYQAEGDGVALISFSIGGNIYTCSGATVNDARQSFRSFFLTAFHCISTVSEASSATFYFKYQSPDCNTSTDDNVYVTLNGATLRAAFAGSDVTLLELNAQAPQAENISFLGWDRSSALSTTVFGIHHPSGSLKKISFGGATELASQGGGAGTSYLQLSWNSGVTEGGSSGSPLFDRSSRRVVGQLWGGTSFCSPPSSQTAPDQYGRFFTSWTDGGTSATRLSDWLDPTGISGNTTDLAVPTVNGPAAFTTASSFSLNTGTSSITAWTVTGGAGIVSPTSGTGNTANLMALSSGTNLTITFGVSAGQSYPIRFAKVFDVSGPPPSITAQPAAASTVCAGASVVVTVGVSGSISGYQWLKGGSPVAGQTGPTLSLGNVQLSDAGVYSLSLTGPAGSTTSSNFTLTVNPVPVVTLTIPIGTTAQGSGGIALITLPPTGFPTTFQASGGTSYERQIVLDQINGYAIRQVDQNTSGIFTINRTGLFTLTVTGAGGCQRTVQWVVQAQ